MLTIKQHHEHMITKLEATTRLAEVDLTVDFLIEHGITDFSHELEDIEQLELEASYGWVEL